MRLILLGAVLLLPLPSWLSGQGTKKNDAPEQEIRRLDLAPANAVLRGDIAALDKLWAEDLTINSPFNEITTGRAGRIRAGTLTYSSFVRDIERVLIHEETVIVMGRETVIPKGTSPDAGKTIRRRYTNIWMKKKGRWRMVARHASVICQT